VAQPIEEFMGLNYSQQLKQVATANKLPEPLYTLYFQAALYLENNPGLLFLNSL
jgi:hypothetical protein